MIDSTLVFIAQATQAPTTPGWQVSLTLATALATFAAAIVGFLKAHKELAEQKRLLTQQRTDLNAFSQAFSNLQSLRSALSKPLEGVWNVRVPYNRFHNSTAEKYFGNGIAIFLWRGSTAPRGYDIYVGGHVTKGSQRDQIVCVFCHLRLITDENGLPSSPFQITGRYVSRVSKEPSSAQTSTDPEAFEYRNGTLETDSDGNVISITLEFDAGTTNGPVIFTRA